MQGTTNWACNALTDLTNEHGDQLAWYQACIPYGNAGTREGAVAECAMRSGCRGVQMNGNIPGGWYNTQKGVSCPGTGPSTLFSWVLCAGEGNIDEHGQVAYSYSKKTIHDGYCDCFGGVIDACGVCGGDGSGC